MSFIGKVLIVVQIVLSIMFAALATTVFTYHRSWKEISEQRQATVQDQEREMATVTSDFNKRVDELNQQLVAAKSRADGAESKLKDVTVEKNNLQANYDRVSSDFQRVSGVATINADEANFRLEEALAQRVENKLLHEKLDSYNDQIIELKNELFNTNTEMTSLTAKYNTMLENNAFLKRVVRLNNLETDPAVYQAKLDPPPAVEGLVLDTQLAQNGTVEFVKISLGSDDGLVEGHELDVYRTGLNGNGPSKYLGKIKLSYLTPDTAVGTIVSKAKNGIIEKGDNVTSNF